MMKLLVLISFFFTLCNGSSLPVQCQCSQQTASNCFCSTNRCDSLVSQIDLRKSRPSVQQSQDNLKCPVGLHCCPSNEMRPVDPVEANPPIVYQPPDSNPSFVPEPPVNPPSSPQISEPLPIPPQSHPQPSLVRLSTLRPKSVTRVSTYYIHKATKRPRIINPPNVDPIPPSFQMPEDKPLDTLPPRDAIIPQPKVYNPFAGECGKSQRLIDVRKNKLKSNTAGFAQYPWQAKIIIRSEDGHQEKQCGGVLVGDDRVLTVAHCFNGISYKPSTIKVRLGDYDLSTSLESLPSHEYHVKSVDLHPNYDSDMVTNDIAQIHLTTPVRYQLNVRKICLPADNEVYYGKKCVVTGWGVDKFVNGTFATKLKKVDLPVIDHNQCQDMYRKTRLGEGFVLHDSFICAGGRANEDACFGDGGGPLACERENGDYVLVGLVSWSIGCGTEGIPGAYTDVLKLRSFVLSAPNPI